MKRVAELIASVLDGLEPAAGDRWTLDEATLAGLRRKLDALSGTADLGPAIGELCVLACWLGEAESSPALRDVLLGLAEERLLELQVWSRARPRADGERPVDRAQRRALTGDQTAPSTRTAEPRRGAVRSGPLARALLDSGARRCTPKPKRRK